MMRMLVAFVFATGCFYLPERHPGAFGDADIIPACWNPELSNHDEDVDGLVDGCDNCPADPNPNQEDGDHDGVGDVCDPRPTMKDHIAFFDGFGAAQLDPAWLVVPISGAPSWNLGNDMVHETGSSVLELADRMFTAGAIVDVRFDTINSMPLAGARVRADGTTASANNITCYAGNHELSVSDGNSSNTGSVVVNNLGGRTRLVVNDTGTCTVFANSPTTTSLLTLAASAPGYVGLYANVSADFASITVFEP